MALPKKVMVLFDPEQYHGVGKEKKLQEVKRHCGHLRPGAGGEELREEGQSVGVTKDALYHHHQLPGR